MNFAKQLGILAATVAVQTAAIFITISALGAASDKLLSKKEKAGD